MLRTQIALLLFSSAAMLCAADIDPCSLVTKDEVNDALKDQVTKVDPVPHAKSCTFYLTKSDRLAGQDRVAVIASGGHSASEIDQIQKKIGGAAQAVSDLGDKALVRTDPPTVYVLKGDSLLTMQVMAKGKSVSADTLTDLARKALGRLP